MALSVISNSILVLQNESCRASITVQDDVITDPYRLIVKAIDIGNSIVFQDMWPNPDNRIIRTATGQFYIDVGPAKCELNGAHSIGINTLTVRTVSPRNSAAWPTTGTILIDFDSKLESVQYTSTNISNGTGTITLATPITIAHASGAIVIGPNNSTNSIGELMLDWQIELTNGDNLVNTIEKVVIVSAKSISLMPEFKLLIDKAHKLVSTSNDNFLGYTDAQLISYLYGGLANINAYQPTLAFSMENFPFEYKQILLDAALITGVMSQQLFAIDSDVQSYSDNGVSYVISHQPQLAGFLNALTQRLDRIIPQMKLAFISSGSIHTQMGPGYRLQTLIGAAPSGSIFRNTFST